MTLRKLINEFCACISRQDELYDLWGKKQGIRPSTSMVLYALDQLPGCTQRDISRMWLLPKQTVHMVIQELEEQGYLSKQPGQTSREKSLTLTEAGLRYAHTQLNSLYQAEERAAKAIGKEEFAHLVEANRRFTEAFAKEVLQ